jgi:hypothetical protein
MANKVSTGLRLPTPNPEDWMDLSMTAEALGRSRPAVYDYVKRNVLTAHKIGRITMFWRPEVDRAAAALRVLESPEGWR